MATAAGCFNAWLLSKLAILFNGRSVNQFLEQLGLALLGKLIGLIYIVFSLLVAVLTFRDFADLMVTVFYPETPMIVFVITMAFLVSWAVYEGMEVIARMAQFLFPFIIIGIVFSGLLSVNQVQLKHFLPVVEHGLKPVLKGAFTQYALFGDIVFWFLLLPHLNETGHKLRFMPLSIVFSGMLLILVLILLVNGLGAGVAARQTYPFLSLVKDVSLAGFVERIESMFLIIWVASNFMKIVVFFYAATFGISQYFKRVNRIYIIGPLIILSAILSTVFFENYDQLRQVFRPGLYGIYSVVLQVVIPVLIVLAWAIKSKFGKLQTNDPG